MSPPIISTSTTPTQSRFTTPKQDFSPGLSRPNSMTPRNVNLESRFEEWINGLTSPLSTASERISVLNDIEKTLVKITATESGMKLVGLNQTSTFWALQAAAGFNLTQVLLAHVYRMHLELERENESIRSSIMAASGCASIITESLRQRVHLSVSEVCISIAILQGLTLCSGSNKRIASRKSSLELLLCIVLADYCTQLLPCILCPASPLTPTSPAFPGAPTCPATPTITTASSPRKPKPNPTDAPLSLPSGFALDLLMCILVDSPTAQERFSDMGGIHQIVQLSHKCADTVTTPTSTPTLTDLTQAAARSSHITALKQTDLLCLEFRYFWSQVLDSESRLSSSLETMTSKARTASTAFDNVNRDGQGSRTPKASPSKRASRKDLRGETPKASLKKTTRATSEEAPTRPSSSRDEIQGNPSRKLRHSTSVAELRKKSSSLARSTSAVPPLPSIPTKHPSDSPISIKPETDVLSSVSSPLSSRRHRQPLTTSASRPTTSEIGSQVLSTSSVFGERRQDDRLRGSTVSEAPISAAVAAAVVTEPNLRLAERKFVPNRPGMASRDRPRIPSPLKRRTPEQEAAERLEAQVLGKDSKASAAQHAISYRRLRSSTISTRFDGGESEQRAGGTRAIMGDGDVENCNPFSAITITRNFGGDQMEKIRRSPTSLINETITAVGGSASRSTNMQSATSGFSITNDSGSSLFSGMSMARIPPSPAVRRAQMARARSLSPTKLCLPSIASERSVADL
ncbi:related to Don3 interacting protein [Melanopsichium pennsylvanicum]|uniref:Related to Don3 interacting protein n=2 Tax=Melanopsichium pennsylvanicum TaxID=63383 RepID=A0AAJ5C6D7_9BASI|nr:Don3 interacting protein [Melanopsichium pennsylvanicum 4]SNX85740.1 related to Don3 interacting protein [Melanopsichium pennsylvanicum]